VNLTNLFRLQAIVAALYAIGLVVIPDTVGGLLSPLERNALTIETARLFGGSLLLLALISWGASTLESQPARRMIARALLISEALGLILALIGQLQGVWGPLGWSTVVVYLLFTLGYAYFLFVQPE
jgi:hypothetical protein